MFQLKSTCCLENRRESLGYLMCNSSSLPASLHTLARQRSLQTARTSLPGQTHLPLGGSEAALLHRGSLLQCKHHQLEGTGQKTKGFYNSFTKSTVYRIFTSITLECLWLKKKKANSFIAAVPLCLVRCNCLCQWYQSKNKKRKMWWNCHKTSILF